MLHQIKFKPLGYITHIYFSISQFIYAYYNKYIILASVFFLCLYL